ncbi:hypothetical protein [Burkholderia sp. 22313]|uniref:hypothetical protein n=1 Tax=Burkholderia sp. 22313 TaxID=3453908 RepID=UPI003F83014E
MTRTFVACGAALARFGRTPQTREITREFAFEPVRARLPSSEVAAWRALRDVRLRAALLHRDGVVARGRPGLPNAPAARQKCPVNR